MSGPDFLHDDRRGLVIRLLTQAGMIMEDASVVAVLSPGEGVPLAQVVSQLQKASSAIAALVCAAKALVSE